jgi:hypothetical protein
MPFLSLLLLSRIFQLLKFSLIVCYLEMLMFQPPSLSVFPLAGVAGASRGRSQFALAGRACRAILY